MRHSLSAQISYYSATIQRRIEWEYAGVYADEPMTGTKENRPEFQRMLSNCRAEKIDMIITKSITRFARNTLTTLASVRELKTLGIDVFFEKENIHSLSSDGELMLSILASYAQEESRSISENCKWRIRKMFQQGRPNTGNLLGYRLKDGKLRIVPEEAEIVRQIFSVYLGGMGTPAISKNLNASGVPTKKGEPWTDSTINDILRNVKYVGDLILQKKYTVDFLTKKQKNNEGEVPQYYVENSHPAIISLATFELVQGEIRRRGLFGKNVRSKLFAGHILCGECGAVDR